MRFCLRTAFLLAFFAVSTGCEFQSSPEFLAMEAEIGPEFFGGTYAYASHIRRDFEIQTNDQNGNLIRLLLPQIRLGKFVLGQDSYAEATVVLQSYRAAEASSSFNKIGKGEIEITKIDLADSTVSGRFWFDASEDLDPTNVIAVRSGIFRRVSISGAFDNPLFTQPFEFRNAGQKIALRQGQLVAIDAASNYFILRAQHASGQQMELRFPADLAAGASLNSFAVKSKIGVFYISENGSESFQTVKSGSFEILQNDLTARVVEARFSLVVKTLNGSTEESLTDGYLLFNY